MAELDRTWADRRIKQLVGRGGLSGSKRDREELKDLIEFEKSNRYSESILQSNLADARGRQSQAAATVQAAQIGAQGEMSEKAESKIFDYFDKRAQLFKDAEDYDSAQEVWDIYADETLTVSQKIAALKKLKVMKGTSTSDIEGAKAKLFGSNSGG